MGSVVLLVIFDIICSDLLDTTDVLLLHFLIILLRFLALVLKKTYFCRASSYLYMQRDDVKQKHTDKIKNSMIKQFFSSHRCAVVRTFFVLCTTLMLASACTVDKTEYTGKLNIEFTQWNPEWTDHLFILVSPLEQKDKIIKQVKVVSKTVNSVELNPGNYYILIKADNNDFTPRLIRYVQVQIGKTENVEI